MEDSHYHHHHHSHHGHDISSLDEGQQSHHETRSQDDSGVTGYDQREDTVSRKSEHQSVNRSVAPVLVPRPPDESTNKTRGGVQATSSFHSVSSMGSSAEMARYFPDSQAPSLSPFSRHQQEVEGQQTQTPARSSTAGATNTSTVNVGPYISVSALRQPIRAPGIVRPPVTPQYPPGIPSYPSQVTGIFTPQALVNDAIVDLQSKVINKSQEQYDNESSTENYLLPLAPIHVRAPNPTIILRSDLHRLRAEFNNKTRPPVPRFSGVGNRFQTPSFPPPRQQHIPPGSYGGGH